MDQNNNEVDESIGKNASRYDYESAPLPPRRRDEKSSSLLRSRTDVPPTTENLESIVLQFFNDQREVADMIDAPYRIQGMWVESMISMGDSS
jgi:hypothetical protein